MKSKLCQEGRNLHEWCMNRNSSETHCTCSCHIVRSIGNTFATFGGGRGNSDFNPLVLMLKDKPLMFAAGVDVRQVVDFIRAAVEKKTRKRRKKR